LLQISFVLRGRVVDRSGSCHLFYVGFFCCCREVVRAVAKRKLCRRDRLWERIPPLNSFAVKAPLLTLSLDKQFGFLSDCLLLEMCKRKSSIQLDNRNAETSELQAA
jgi:hypothetical protein